MATEVPGFGSQACRAARHLHDYGDTNGSIHAGYIEFIEYRGRPHLRQGRLASHSFPGAVLPGVLSGPGQRGLRQAADAQGPEPERRGLRPGRGDLLPRLFHLRDSQQPDPAPRGRQGLDRPHHDHLGHHLRGHDVHQLGDHLLRAALPAGRGRGRLLPGHRALPDLLVSQCPPRPHDDALHAGRSAVGPDRRPHLGLDHVLVRRRRPWPGRLAVAIPAGRHPRDHHRHRCAVLPGRPHREGQVADR